MHYRKEPDGTMTPLPWWAHFSCGDTDWFATEDEARKACEDALGDDRDAASDDGWPEETTHTMYGRVVGHVVETERVPWNKHRREMGDSEEDIAEACTDFDYYADYGLRRVDDAPTPAEVREVLEQAEDALTAALDPDGACPKEIGDAWDAVHALLARLPEDPA